MKRSDSKTVHIHTLGQTKVMRLLRNLSNSEKWCMVQFSPKAVQPHTHAHIRAHAHTD